MSKSGFRVGLLVGAAFINVAPARAQNNAHTEPSWSDAEIVVTAQNRRESVQDVPIAISVVSGERLQEAGVTDLRELDRVSPAVQITQDQQNTYVSVRGIGTASNNETQDTSVTINIDGEYINRTTVLNAALFDIERVEVLRGPQGTLYGRNATAGAVNFITRKPGTELGVNGSVSYGNYNQVIVNAGVDLPVSDTFAVRVSGIYSNRHKGYTFHPNIAGLRTANLFANSPFKPNYSDRSGTQDMKGGRGSIRWEPTDGLRVDAAVEYVDSYAILENYRFVNLNAAGFGPGPNCSLNGYVQVAPLVPGVQCVPQNTNFLQNVDRDSYDAPTTGVGYQKLESFAARGRIAYDFGPAILTYIGGYRSSKTVERPTLPPAYQFLDFGSKVETQSHELRVNGGTDGGFLYQFGGFFYREELNQQRGLYNPFIGAPPPPKGSYITYFRRSPVVSQNWSVFGQVDLPLTDKLTAQGGLRYNKGKRHAIFENYGFVFNSGPVPLTSPATQTLNLAQSEDNVSWLAGLNYKPNHATLLYAKVSTGFKGGGFDAVGDYGPEKNTAYEAGLKLNFGPRNRHTLNLSGFYYDYRGLQNAVLLDNARGGQIFNAGKATIWGLEAEWNFQIDPDNRFYGSFNYLHARFDELLAAYAVICTSGCSDASIGDLDPVAAGVQQPNLAGNTPPQSPRVVLTAGYDHIFRLGDAGSITASVFTRFKSRYFLTIFNERDLQQKAFTQTDFNLTYRPVNEKFSVGAFVQNIEDVRPAVFGSFVAAGPDRVLNIGYSRPRTYGARVTFDF